MTAELAKVDNSSQYAALMKREDGSGHVKTFVAFLENRGGGLSEGALHEYSAWLRDPDRNYRASTVNVKLAKAVSAVRWVLEQTPDVGPLEEYRIDKAMRRVKRMKTNTRAVGREKVLSKDEVQRLLSRTKDHRLRLMMAFLWRTGCRVAEMLGARVADGRRQRDYIILRVVGKGSKEREVKLPVGLWDRIREEFAGLELLFEKGDGSAYSRIATTNRISAAAAAALQREGISAHSFRHSFATYQLLAKSWDLKKLSTYLGHSSTAIPADMYVHSTAEWTDLAEGDERDFDALVDGSERIVSADETRGLLEAARPRRRDRRRLT